jgi:hypothetical protein
MGIELSDQTARDATPPSSGQSLMWDSEVKGFALRITKAGAKAWVLNFRASGVQRQMTIGSFPDWSCKAAREQAKALKREIDMGSDPMLERHEQRAAPTFADLAEHYRKTHLPRKRLSGQTSDNLILEKHVLPKLGNRKLAAIRHSDIAALHGTISKHTPIAANRVISLLSKMFGLAIKQEWMETNSAKGIERNAENRRERYLSPAEIGRLVEALRAHPERNSANAIMLMLWRCPDPC